MEEESQFVEVRIPTLNNYKPYWSSLNNLHIIYNWSVFIYLFSGRTFYDGKVFYFLLIILVHLPLLIKNMCFSGIHPNLDSQQITDTLKLALMIGDVRLKEEKEGVAGDIYILDAVILGPSLLARLSPSTIKKFMICVQVRLITLNHFAFGNSENHSIFSINTITALLTLTAPIKSGPVLKSFPQGRIIVFFGNVTSNFLLIAVLRDFTRVSLIKSYSF